jgi:hypothetical protein
MRLFVLLCAAFAPAAYAQSEAPHAQIEQIASVSSVAIEQMLAAEGESVVATEVSGGTAYAFGEGNLLTLVRSDVSSTLAASDASGLLVQGTRNTVAVTQQTAGNTLNLSVVGTGNRVTVVQQ